MLIRCVLALSHSPVEEPQGQAVPGDAGLKATLNTGQAEAWHSPWCCLASLPTR